LQSHLQTYEPNAPLIQGGRTGFSIILSMADVNDEGVRG